MPCLKAATCVGYPKPSAALYPPPPTDNHSAVTTGNWLTQPFFLLTPQTPHLQRPHPTIILILFSQPAYVYRQVCCNAMQKSPLHAAKSTPKPIQAASLSLCSSAIVGLKCCPTLPARNLKARYKRWQGFLSLTRLRIGFLVVCMHRQILVKFSQPERLHRSQHLTRANRGSSRDLLLAYRAPKSLVARR